jgi:hypothetical protein
MSCNISQVYSMENENTCATAVQERIYFNSRAENWGLGLLHGDADTSLSQLTRHNYGLTGHTGRIVAQSVLSWGPGGQDTGVGYRAGPGSGHKRLQSYLHQGVMKPGNDGEVDRENWLASCL